jgi:hypothetical protein
MDYAARSFGNFGIEENKRLIDLVWLWFGSPHDGLLPTFSVDRSKDIALLEDPVVELVPPEYRIRRLSTPPLR